MNNDLAEIKAVFDADKKEIIATHKGIGAGIGVRDQQYTIVIYTDDPAIKLPPDAVWKDIPLVIEYTGRIIPH